MEERNILISDYLNIIKEKRPVVQCITNIVTVNDCANALLAIGASPTMAHDPDEMADFAEISDSLVCNMGATESYDAMKKAGILAREKGHPVVIDPVGCAGSAVRREKCLALISLAAPSCIRGNAAEIKALAENCDTGRGVDDLEKDLSGAETADENPEKERVKRDVMLLSKKTGAIVIASGETDIIGYGSQLMTLDGGSPFMKYITGAGCMLSSVMGAFMAAENSINSAAACCAFMNSCAEKAEKWTKRNDRGTGTFHISLLDAMSTME